MMNKKGFISTSVIFAFFITFLLLLVIVITSYAQNRILMNQVKKDIKSNLILNIEMAPKFKIGDYIELVPSNTEYIIDPQSTGCSSQQIINPKELYLWRIISIDEDGKVQMISEYASTVKICFYGQAGYNYLKNTLKNIAKSYENDNYTIGSRYIADDGSQDYNNDIDLIKNVLGTDQTTNPSGSSTTYWLSYTVESQTGLYAYYAGDSRYGVYYSTLYSNSTNTANSFEKSVRPIVYISESEISNATGLGTVQQPYILP